MQAFADIGAKTSTAKVVATRGERLVLCRSSISGDDQQPGAFHIEFLNLIEIDADEQIVARVAFDADDFNAAIAELDSRYIAGEAAAHAATWSVIAAFQAAVSRREIPEMTPNPGYIDHRPLAGVDGVDLVAAIHGALDVTSNFIGYAEEVHRLDELGAVYTQVMSGSSLDGFEFEWRMVEVQLVEGDLLGRVEVFDETDLEAALARFDELIRKKPHHRNNAVQLIERLQAVYAARDWKAAAALLADNICTDDRRRAVNAGVRHGRDAELESLKAAANVGSATTSSAVLATRGKSLALAKFRFSDKDRQASSFHAGMLGIIEVDDENRAAAIVMFDPDDLDAALDELDARYLNGEATAYAGTWSVIQQACAALNRQEVPATTPDFVDLDHRSIAAIGPGDLKAYIRAALNDGEYQTYIESVHRLSDRGALVTVVSRGTSREDFDDEWRTAHVFGVEGDLISRAEMFDETDIDAALARFEELDQRQLPENTATQLWARLAEASNRRDLENYLALSGPSLRYEDRRRGLRDEFEGVRAQRNAVLALFGATPHSVQMTAIPIAVRGSRLAIMHVCYRDTDYPEQPITVEMIQTVEVDSDGLFDLCVSFDPDDIDAAFDELDARYLVGEASAFHNTWSVIARTYAGYGRNELPPGDWINVDHRQGTPFTTSDHLTAVIRTWREMTPDFHMHIESVHQLNEYGAVITHTSSGTSPEGFTAEWRMVQLLTVDGNRIDRCEMFDETDVGTAVARLEELSKG